MDFTYTRGYDGATTVDAAKFLPTSRSLCLVLVQVGQLGRIAEVGVVNASDGPQDMERWQRHGTASAHMITR